MPIFSLVQRKKTTNYEQHTAPSGQRTNNSFGFTLVELLVVIAMIAIISVIVAVNFNGNREEQFLQRELLKLQSTIKLAQANASSSVVCQDLGGGASWKLTVDPSVRKVTLNCQKEEDIKEDRSYFFEKGLDVSFACSQTGTSFLTPIDITFNKLSGLPTFSGIESCGEDFSAVVIKLQSEKDTTLTKEFTISSGGAINAK